MNESWKIAALSGAVGAVAAVAVVFGSASLGFFPSPSDKQFRTYLMSHPSIVMAMAEKAQIEQMEAEQRQLQDAVDKIGLKTYFNPQIAFSTGPASAKKTLVEFFDYNCAHCRNSFPLVQKYYNAHKADTRFAFIELPIFGEKSNNAARAALAARRQPDKYVAFHFALMAEDGEIGPDQIVDAARKAGLDVNKLMADLSEPSITKEMAAAHALAARTGITGTPFFIINGKAHSGEVDEASLKEEPKG
jgi:protein-disulfide isomerase